MKVLYLIYFIVAVIGILIPIGAVYLSVRILGGHVVLLIVLTIILCLFTYAVIETLWQQYRMNHKK